MDKASETESHGVAAEDLPGHLLHTFASAELTTCLLMPTKLKDTDPDSIVNAFSVLVFRTAPPPKKIKRFNFLTNRLENLPDGHHRFLAAHSILSIDEALELTTFATSFCDPKNTPKRSISAPGEWLPKIFVGREEHPLRECLPYIRHSFWAREHWHPANALAQDLGEDGILWLQQRLEQLLRIRIQRRHLGSFFAVLPDERVRMRVERSHDGSRLGIEVRRAQSNELNLMVLARGSRRNVLVTSAVHQVAQRFTVVPFAPEIDLQEVELYDADSGVILDRDAGIPLRGYSMTTVANPRDVDVTVNLDRADGGSSPIRYRASRGWIQRSEVGATSEWEAAHRLASIKAEQEELYRQGHLFVYVGGAEERQRAVADIKNLIRVHARTHLDIWDPYFGAKDAIDFLPSVIDASLPIRVLTSVEPTLGEKDDVRDAQGKVKLSDATGTSRWFHACAPIKFLMSLTARRRSSSPPMSAREINKRNLRKAISALHVPGAGVPGLTQLRCRLGSANFHDRFMMTESMCWQLGCSFNQIGQVVSTIVVLPCPDVIRRAFDDAWERVEEDL